MTPDTRTTENTERLRQSLINTLVLGGYSTPRATAKLDAYLEAAQRAAPRAEGSDKNPGHEHVWRCDYCEAVAPRAEGLDERLLGQAIQTVVEHDRYDLAYTTEGWRLAKAAAAEYARLAPQERRD